MTPLTRMVSAFFLTLIVGLVISTANGLDLVHALQGSTILAWLCSAIVVTISLVMETARALLVKLGKSARI